MVEVNPERKNSRFPEIIIAIVLVAITVIASLYLLYPTLFPNSEDNNNNNI